MGVADRPAGVQTDARWLLTLVLALAALLGLRIAALSMNATDLFFDEAQYWSWAQQPDVGYYSKPPLIAWLIYATTEVCGDGEFCVRLSSPIVHTLTALVVFLIGQRLYDTRTGVLAGLVFATLPGVSVSAGIISTDVPLLLCWALALYAFVLMLETRSWWPALLLGGALGLGLNAKYAMAWFGLSVGIYLAVTPSARRLLGDARLYVALLIAAALIAPNILWNLAHKFATFAHTADNAKWHGSLINPLKALEFVGAQFGVFGPILFAALMVLTWRAWRDGAPEADRLLLSFALPVVVIIAGQALVSRAHANWAAVSYVAASVLVTASMIRELDWKWLKGSLALHTVMVVAVAVAAMFAGRFALPSGVDPYARTLGWRQLAEATRGEIAKAARAGTPYAAVVADERSVTAELIYYMRDERTPVLAWKAEPRPQDHFELTRPYTPAVAGPVVLVSLAAAPDHITTRFSHARQTAVVDIPAGAGKPRRITFFALEGYTGK